MIFSIIVSPSRNNQLYLLIFFCIHSPKIMWLLFQTLWMSTPVSRVPGASLTTAEVLSPWASSVAPSSRWSAGPGTPRCFMVQTPSFKTRLWLWKTSFRSYVSSKPELQIYSSGKLGFECICKRYMILKTSAIKIIYKKTCFNVPLKCVYENTGNLIFNT